MIAKKFQVRDLIIHVSPEDGKGCEGGYSEGYNTTHTICQIPSCKADCKHHHTFQPATDCDRPTCKEPPPRRGVGIDELASGNLALLQQELRQALELGR